MNFATFTPAPARARLAIHCLLAFASLANAQEQDTTLPTVVVTARADDGGLAAQAATGSNLGLSRLETPASIDIVTRKQLEERGDASLLDAITRAPGISAMPHPGNGNSSVAARGFTDTTSVMRLYDGMRQYGGAGLTFPFDTWSVERIEVLRGPASVIHGDGAIGGVINVVPKQPTRGAPEHELQLGIGNEHSRRAAFGSGGAIDERWSYRLDASTERADGWVDMGEHSSRAISGALRFDVSPVLDIRLSTARGKQEPMRYFGTPLVDGKPVPALAGKNYNVADSVMTFDDRWTDLLVNWRPGDGTAVRSRFYRIASKRHWRDVEGYYYNAATGLLDRADATEIYHAQSQTGNTTDMTAKGQVFGLSNSVSAGFDINSTRFTHANNTYVGSVPSVDLYAPVPGNFASPVPTIARYRTHARQYALFAEDRLQWTEKWSVLAGLRYDHAELARDDLVAGRQAFERTFTNVGWRLGTVYQATPALAVYGQFAKAADPIGALLFLSTSNSRFDNATGRQFEVGIKHAFAAGGEWTLAVYDIAKNNLLTRDSANPAQSLQVGERSSRGIEATVAAALAPGWRIEANASLLRARFDDFTESVGGQAVSRAGNTPPDVPRRLANVWLNWDFQPGWAAGAGLRYVGERNADNANTLKMPGYAVTDLSLRWQAAPRTKVTLRAANVFDRRYFTTAYYMPEQWFYGPDRKLDLVLDHRF
jgi:iron complex outermembrane receptor protein